MNAITNNKFRPERTEPVCKEGPLGERELRETLANSARIMSRTSRELRESLVQHAALARRVNVLIRQAMSEQGLRDCRNSQILNTLSDIGPREAEMDIVDLFDLHQQALDNYRDACAQMVRELLERGAHTSRPKT